MPGDGSATATMAGPEEFAKLADPFRAELLAHCKRMLGSVHDAEDQVQETFLRAWRSYGDFEGRSSLRTWLYRIATNVCLNALESRRRLPVPFGFPGAEGDQDRDAGWPEGGPQAASRVARETAAEAAEQVDPAMIVATREDRRRALLVMWERLSPRQRAVLILRDVLSWQANEIADLLGTSGTAVHSMLRRARAQLAQAPTVTEVDEPDDVTLRGFLAEYAAAFETGDINALVYLLTEDAVCRRQPSDTVLSGRAAIVRFLAHCPAVGQCRMVPISVNGRPGFGVYRAGEDGVYRSYTIDVLTISTSGFERIEVIEDRSLFGTFGLPQVLPAEANVEANPA
ncbi:RNA polymerase subunit sigma-70 [Saccharothrix violaceirubra]|uniref:RNA polymerase sigma-70 factor (ECF subfamily) n=1 Tax=Saccharothrix violaceirubra TaxID=413306 RepID=A0A7W7WWG3_9PSEU|nr:RNA polymerase subunit sigma-70 [Saccharothrix violaceirubra]MBB4966320.1 RNA polymerase sigma-70 factor (ECF subfamily) [Saccharothrix violaceirubra]